MPSGAFHLLHPGDVVCAERGDTLETLLGSCIAVLLSDRKRTVAAMCHIVHCRPSLSASARTTASTDGAIDALYALLQKRALTPRLCDAFVCGGGNMFPGMVSQNPVGTENARCVLQRLAADGVHVERTDIGGNTYRRLRWVVGPESPTIISVDV
jgi:chemotaxis protein CheD